jgi:hypothetical protein
VRRDYSPRGKLQPINNLGENRFVLRHSAGPSLASKPSARERVEASFASRAAHLTAQIESPAATAGLFFLVGSGAN